VPVQRSTFDSMPAPRTIGARLAVATMTVALAQAQSAPREHTVAEIASGIAQSHRDFLRAPGGIRLEYGLRSTQDPIKGYFLWDDGEGRVAVLWPKIFSKFRGREKKSHKVRDREGEYNFESKVGGGRDATFAQFAPYRQAWSAVNLFPLKLMFFDEADQYFVPGKVHKTDYWLPSALEQENYAHDGVAIIDGVRCEILNRSDGLDRLWVASDRGFVVCRREIRDKKSGKLAEVVQNQRLKHITGSLWFPALQTQEVFSQTYRITRDTGKPTFAIQLSVASPELGKVNEGELHISVPPGTRVQDDIASVTYVKSRGGEFGMPQTIESARVQLAKRRPIVVPRRTTIGLGVMMCVLTMTSAMLGFRRFFRNSLPRQVLAGRRRI
jgi:hypothetical protein